MIGMILSACLLPTYDVLSEEQIKRINENSFLVRHRKFESIFSQDKPVSYVMFVRSGLVKLFKDADKDKSVILKIAGPSSYLGILSVFNVNLYAVSASSLEDSEIVYAGLPMIRDLICENGQYALHLMKAISAEGMYMVNRMIAFSQKQIPGRIAEVLLYFSKTVYNSDQYTLPLSRQELADLVSSTKESVSRTLTEFKNDRMIEIDDKKVVLKSKELLEILSKMG
jgi:CRP-like cAMP-binding protein